MEQSTEHYVDHDVDGPDLHVSNKHLSRLPQNVPEQQQVQRDRAGNYGPNGRAQTLYAVAEQADKATNGERIEDLYPFVDQIESQTPGQRRKENSDVEKNIGASSAVSMFCLVSLGDCERASLHGL